jgi:hypothetical protein
MISMVLLPIIEFLNLHTGFVISAPSFGAFLLYNITEVVGIESA